MMYAILFLVTVALAYVNGANDNIKPFATVYGSRVTDYRRTIRYATVAQVAGSIMSVAVAGALIKAFGGKGFVPDDLVGSIPLLASVGIGAAVAVGIATLVGAPISTTHALVGGLAGAALAVAPSELSWWVLVTVFMIPLLVSPGLAMIVVSLLYPVASRTRKALGVEATTRVVAVPVVNSVMQEDGELAMTTRGMSLAVEQPELEITDYEGRVLGIDAQRIADTLHMGSAMSLGFARGLNDTPKILGLVAAVHIVGGAGAGLSLLVLTAAMAVGGLLHARRIADTLGEKVTSINRGQGLLANAVSSALVIGASLIGSPVSTTHVSSGAIFGVGIWTGDADWRVVGNILLAWVATLPVAAVTAYAVMAGIGSVA